MSVLRDWETLAPDAGTIERAAKLVAALVALIYVTGFVIVTLHLARYGIGQIELFRPKVLASGLCFFGIMALAWVVGSTAMASATQTVTKHPFPDRARWAALFVSLPLVADGAAVFVGIVLFQDPVLRPTVAGVLMILVGTTIAVVALKRPIATWILFSLAVVAGALVLSGSISNYSEPAAKLMLWFCGVAVIVPVVRWASLHGLSDGGTPWPVQLVFWTSILLAFYATNIYAHIKPVWGGGAPVRIDITLLAPGGATRTVQNELLIEETQHGFYVLQGEAASRFIRRDRVEEIRFHTGGSPGTPVNSSVPQPSQNASANQPIP